MSEHATNTMRVRQRHFPWRKIVVVATVTADFEQDWFDHDIRWVYDHEFERQFRDTSEESQP